MIVLISIMYSMTYVYAFSFPNELWAPLEKYEKAMNEGNDIAMLEYAEIVIPIVENMPESEMKTQFLSGKYYQLGQCCERLQLYDKAIDYYAKYIPYGKKMDQADGVLYASRKTTLLQKRLEVYVEAPFTSESYYGAKFEPQSGVYFGAAYDNDRRISDFRNDNIRSYFPKQNSVYLVYLEFGDDISKLPRYTGYFTEAKKNNAAIMLAWNIYQDLTLDDEQQLYIKQTLDYLGDTDVKFFLRFGAEMNIMDDITDADAYINAFRYVSQYAKAKGNIALVWSPSDLGAINKPFERFYPGDDYVDWIGVSLYAMPYFQGKKDLGENADALSTFFMTGDFANPIMRLQPITDFMRENAINKPLMLSEYGVAHEVYAEKEDIRCEKSMVSF